MHFENISGSAMRYRWASPISGLAKDGVTHPLNNLTFTNVSITNKGGLTAIPADPPEYAPLVTPTDARQGIVTRDVANLVTN